MPSRVIVKPSSSSLTVILFLSVITFGVFTVGMSLRTGTLTVTSLSHVNTEESIVISQLLIYSIPAFGL